MPVHRRALTTLKLWSLCSLCWPQELQAEPSARFADTPQISRAQAASSIPARAAKPAATAELSTSCSRVSWQLSRARSLVARGDILSALTAYHRVLVLERGCASALIELAGLRARLGDFTEAELLYARASRLPDAGAAALLERARWRWRQGRTDAALQDLETAVTLKPGATELRRQLAMWYIEIRAWPAALAQYRALLRILSERADLSLIEPARLQVQALEVLAAEADPVSSAQPTDGWVRRSLAHLIKH